VKSAENYGRLCAAFYDAEKPRPPAKELRFYRSLLGREAGAVLEPMCGSGRFLLPLAQKNYDVIGFDNSEAMIARCHARLAETGLDASRAMLADFETFAPTTRFRQSFIPSGSFGLLDPEEAERALNRHREWLEPGGLLHLEIWPRDPTDAGIRECSARVAEIDASRCIGLVVELETRDDGALHNALCHYTEIVNGAVIATETERYAIRHYAFDRLRAMAKRCGLNWVECRENVFGDSRAVVTLRRGR
jgi:SAM-dependent methyltransferase